MIEKVPFGRRRTGEAQGLEQLHEPLARTVVGPIVRTISYCVIAVTVGAVGPIYFLSGRSEPAPAPVTAADIQRIQPYDIDYPYKRAEELRMALPLERRHACSEAMEGHALHIVDLFLAVGNLREECKNGPPNDLSTCFQLVGAKSAILGRVIDAALFKECGSFVWYNEAYGKWVQGELPRAKVK